MANSTGTEMCRSRGVCSIEECDDPHYSKTFCCRHYRRFQKYGNALAGGPLLRRSKRLPRSSSTQERFWTKVEKTDDCWPWIGAIGDQGYGVVIRGRKWTGAHRVAWEYSGRSLDPDLTLDHLCHTRDLTCPGGSSCPHRRCVNPDHLEQVSRVENTARGRGPTVLNTLKTHCPRGHEYTPENTYRQPVKAGRFCRECGRAATAAYRQRKRAESA